MPRFIKLKDNLWLLFNPRLAGLYKGASTPRANPVYAPANPILRALDILAVAQDSEIKINKANTMKEDILNFICVLN